MRLGNGPSGQDSLPAGSLVDERLAQRDKRGPVMRTQATNQFSIRPSQPQGGVARTDDSAPGVYYRQAIFNVVDAYAPSAAREM